MASPVVYGPGYSTYVRTVRLVLEEREADYRLIEVDLMQGQHKTPEHLARHPFGKVPAFEHDGLVLHETSAITRYLDAVLPGRSLTPETPKHTAIMHQLIALADAYTYPAMVGTVAIQRLVVPRQGGTPDEARIQAALPAIQTTLDELERIMDGHPWLVGYDLTLADLHLAPMMAYFSATPEGERLLPSYPGLQRWWSTIAARPSMERTQPRLG
jgi:glutathione S-transferase